MTTPNRPSFLRRLIGLPANELQDDAGDMGTAIGLEYSLDQAAQPSPPAPAGHATQHDGTRRGGWFSRRSTHD